MFRAPAAFTAGDLVRRVVLIATAAVMSASPAALVDQSGRPRDVRVDAATRRAGEALVALADAYARGERVVSDFDLEWRNDFFKARPGTFIPFSVEFAAGALPEGSALLYVRVERLPSNRSRTRTPAAYAYETIFPLRIERSGGDRIHVRRGFAIAPGPYRVLVVLRGTSAGAPPRTAVVERSLEVPDFWTGDLATSSIMLASRLEPLEEPVPAAELDEDPYAVGSHRIHPAESAVYNRQGELIVVFLVYNPAVGMDRQFDVQVDYHLFRKNPGGGVPPGAGQSAVPATRPGEYYVTRTNPQRFTPSMMGPRFDPAAGAPVLAGQVIPLAGFEAGDYRLNIVITDLLSRRSLSRDVMFAVVGS